MVQNLVHEGSIVRVEISGTAAREGKQSGEETDRNRMPERQSFGLSQPSTRKRSLIYRYFKPKEKLRRSRWF